MDGAKGLKQEFFAAECRECGFEYREYCGHIIPCPRCRAEIAIDALKKADSAVASFRALKIPSGLAKEGAEAAEIIGEALKKLDL